MMKTNFFMFLLVFLSLNMLHAQTGNRVFEGAEATNFGVIDLSVPGGQSWSTFRGANPGYFSNVGTASYINAADASANIDGYVKHYATATNQAFSFPVGTGSDLRTLDISGNRAATSEIAVAWILGDPNATTDPTAPNAGTHSTAALGTGLQAVSTVGQWDWQDLTNDAAGVTITVSIPDLTGFAPGPQLRLVGFNGTEWVNLSGVSGASGNTENSTLSGTAIAGITALGIGSSTVIDEDAMITQVYQVGTERWIEVTNISNTDPIAANTVNVHLFNATGDQTGVAPDASLVIASAIAPGQSVLISNSGNTITNTTPGTVTAPIIITDDNLTAIAGGDDTIILSTATGTAAWGNRYDVVTEFGDNTSLVRIDEALQPNPNYNAAEWVVFIDDAILTFTQSANANLGRHPHAPLLSEITGANNETNTLLGLHRIDVTTRTAGAWDNGIPDRSRFVIVDEDYNETAGRLSARRLRVNDTRILGITNNLLVVTNDIVINGQVRLIDNSGDSRAQLVQTHEQSTLVTADADGILLVDQNSDIPSIYRYNYVGSPVQTASGGNDYTIANVFKDGTTPTNFTGIVGTDIAKDITFTSSLDGVATDPITLSNFWFYTFAPSSDGLSGWVQQGNTGAISLPSGFIFKGPGRAQNYTFLGVPKDGTITAPIGANQSYLVANPYSSSISAKEFIEDNLDATTGILYFWEHAGEIDTSTATSGHNFRGYIGGYATRSIVAGVSAVSSAASAAGPINTDLQAEDALLTNANVTADGAEINTDASSVKFIIPSSIDTLNISYRAAAAATIAVIAPDETFRGDAIVDGNVVDLSALTLPATGASFGSLQIAVCTVAGGSVTIANTENNPLEIDFLNISNADGNVACSPNAGAPGAFTYTEPAPYIPIGQGFFVGGDEDGGTITFDNSQREYITEGTESVFFKSTGKGKAKSTDNLSFSDLPVIKLGMTYKNVSDNKDYSRQIAVSFSPFQSFDYDKGYDAQIFDIGSTDFYWKFPTVDGKFVISGVNAITNDLQVPLEVVMGYSGVVSIKIDEMKNVNQSVYINDILTGKSYQLIDGVANLNLDKGTYTDRFTLAFQPLQVLSDDNDVIAGLNDLFVDNEKDEVVISKTEDIFINSVSLYSLLGKEVSVWNIAEQKDSYRLEIKRKLPMGVYIVKLNTRDGELNKKVIIE